MPSVIRTVIGRVVTPGPVIGSVVPVTASATTGPAKAAAEAAAFGRPASVVVAVIAAPVEAEKVPEVEQILSAGAVCLALVNAALASGWGANWLTGWMALDRVFLTEGLTLEAHEFVAGFIHLGTETALPPERPRPDLDRITTWVAE